MADDEKEEWPFELISPYHKEFQLGRYLCDAQIMHAQLKAGEEIDVERVKELVGRYCTLAAHVGMLRAECLRLGRKVKDMTEETERLAKSFRK